MGKPRAKGGTHKPDGRGGSYALVPHVTMDALLALTSPRAVVAFLAILRRFNGFNNGKIGLSMRDLAGACGPDNPANTKAVKELEAAGFLRATRFPKGQRKATEYRFAHISYGAHGEYPATHDYLETEKSTVWLSHTREPSPVLDSHTREKHRVLESHTGATETSQFPDPLPVSDSHTHILHHPEGFSASGDFLSADTATAPAPEGPSAAMDQPTLRRHAMSYLGKAASGTQTDLAHRAGIPGSVLSKFLTGRTLPEHHWMSLQLELGRRGALTGQAASPVSHVDPRLPVTPDKGAPPKSALAWLSSPGDIMVTPRHPAPRGRRLRQGWWPLLDDGAAPCSMIVAPIGRRVPHWWRTVSPKMGNPRTLT